MMKPLKKPMEVVQQAKERSQLYGHFFPFIKKTDQKRYV